MTNRLIGRLGLERIIDATVRLEFRPRLEPLTWLSSCELGIPTSTIVGHTSRTAVT